MTFTPDDLAFDSIAAPLPESSGSTSRTEAPALMSASAWVCMVEALPLALSTLTSLAGRPAAANACFRYGASYWTYRVDVVVSGRSTPTRPLPCAASPVSCFMVEKSDLNSAALLCGIAMGVDADGDDVDVEVVVDELHPETTSPNERTAPVSATDLRADPIRFPSLWSFTPNNLDPYRCTVAFIRNSTRVSLSNCDELDRRVDVRKLPSS